MDVDVDVYDDADVDTYGDANADADANVHARTLCLIDRLFGAFGIDCLCTSVGFAGPATR